jgi:hypothetical protein
MTNFTCFKKVSQATEERTYDLLIFSFLITLPGISSFFHLFSHHMVMLLSAGASAAAERPGPGDRSPESGDPEPTHRNTAALQNGQFGIEYR